MVKNLPEPSFLRGPREFNLAKRGKYTMENDTSRNIVAAVPLYKPNMPLVRINSKVSEVADNFWTVFPSTNAQKKTI